MSRLFLASLGVAALLMSCKSGTETTTPAAPQSPSPPPAVASGRRLLPIDESAKDPSFLKFRNELLEAVDRHDAAYIVSILDKAIRNSFGGDGGIEEFKEMWKPERADSELWTELKGALTHGGAFREDMFWAPYVFSSFPSDLPPDDSYRYGAIVEDNVPLRSKPDANATAVATLSYHVVKQLDEDKVPTGWMKVSTTDGTEGYIPSSTYRNIIDYRAGFSKKSGKWRMVTFLAGD